MVDMLLEWSGDLEVDESGDIANVVGTDELRERIIRRFLTTPQTLVEATGLVALTPDYLFEPSYGGGARAYVDQVINSQVVTAIQSDLLAQAGLESDVDVTGTSISIEVLPNGLQVAATIVLNTGQFIAVPQLTITN
jgi:hypothetical protein